MAQQIEFVGQSGHGYRYLPLEGSGPISPTGANYLFVKVKGEERTVVYAGETECLPQGCPQRLGPRPQGPRRQHHLRAPERHPRRAQGRA